MMRNYGCEIVLKAGVGVQLTTVLIAVTKLLRVQAILLSLPSLAIRSITTR